MKKYFSSSELFSLRNDIPIDTLIGKYLRIHSKISGEYFRFLCPLCKEFQTATNPTTNLARCFRCEKNFNTIDITMIVLGIDFIDSVEFLKRTKQKIKLKRN